MNLLNLNFGSKKSISGINFVYENGKYTALGYYLSPQYKNKSDYIYNNVVPKDKKYNNIISIMFEPGYYLTNIIKETSKTDNCNKIIIVFQTENYLNENMPVTYEHEFNSNKYKVNGVEFTYKSKNHINNIKIKDGKVLIGCHKKTYESHIQGVDDTYLYLFIIVIIISTIYFNRSNDTAVIGGDEIPLGQNTMMFGNTMML